MPAQDISLPTNHSEIKETKQDYTIGLSLADEFFNTLVQALENNKIEDITKEQKHIKQLLKKAFEQDDVNLYAHIITALYNLCIQALDKGRLDQVASILGLEYEDTQHVFHLLSTGQFQVFASFLVSNNTLEKFAEELSKNKNTILAFKQKVYATLSAKGISYAPPSLDKYLNFSAKDLTDEIAHTHYLDFLLNLEFWYTRNEKKAFLETLENLSEVCTHNIGALLTKEAIFDLLDLDESSLDLQWLSDPKNTGLLAELLKVHLFGAFARKHNLSESEMAAFLEGEQNSADTLEDCLKSLNEAIQSQKEIPLQILYLRSQLLLLKQYRQRNVTEAATLLHTLAQTLLDHAADLLNTSSSTEIKELSLLLQKKDLKLIAAFILENSDIESLATLNNRTYMDLCKFKKAILDKLEFFTEPKTLLEEAKTFLESEKPLQDLQKLRFQAITQLKIAFDCEDLKAFSEIVKHIAIFTITLAEQQKFALLHALMQDINVPLTGFFEVLRSKDIKQIHQWLVDSLLSTFIHNNRVNDVHEFSEWFETSLAIEKAIAKQNKADTAFKESVYTELNIKVEQKTDFQAPALLFNMIEPEKIISTIMAALKNKDHKTFYETYQVAIKLANQESYKENSVFVLKTVLELLKIAHESGQQDKIFCILSFVPVCFKKHFNLILELLETNNLPALSFTLIDLYPFDMFFYYNAEKIKSIPKLKWELFKTLSSTETCSFFRAPNQDLLFSEENIHNTMLSLELQFHNTMLSLELQFHSLILRTQISGREKRIAEKEMIDLLGTLFKMWPIIEKHTLAASLKKIPIIIPNTYLKILCELFSQKNHPLLSWISINAESFEQYAKNNGIELDKIYALKSSLYLHVGGQELLKTPKQLLKMLEEVSTMNIASLRILSLEIQSMLKEAFQSNAVEDFSYLLQTIVQHSKTQTLKTHQLLGYLLDEDVEDFCKYLKLVYKGKDGLAMLFLMNHLDFHFNFNAEYLSFRIKVIQHCTKQGFALVSDFNAPCMKNLKSVALEKQTPILNDEMKYRLEEAYLQNDSALFANIIEQLASFAQELYKTHNLCDLITVFELSSEPCEKSYLEEFLVLEQVMSLLEANNLDLLKKCFIDHTCQQIKHFSESHLSYLIPWDNFRKSVYEKSNIVILNLYENQTPYNFERDKQLLIDSIRSLANKGADLTRHEKLIVVLAKQKPIMDILPAPIDTDSKEYQVLYKKMKQIWIEHLVAHRFGILDKHLEGSYAVTMAAELKTAYAQFLNSEPYKVALANLVEIKALQEHPNPTAILDSISSDIQDIFLIPDVQKLNEKIAQQRIVAIPVFLQSEILEDSTWAHLTAAVIFSYQDNAYCILSDRGGVISDDNLGMVIYKIKNLKNIAATAKTLLESDNKLTVKVFKEAISSLDLEEVYKIEKKMQKSGNCGWSSSAKMLMYSIVFANNLISLNTSFEQSKAMTTPFYKAFSHFDREDILARYLQQCTTLQCEPNISLLTQMFIKSEHRPHRQGIITQINELKIDKENRAAGSAYEMAYKKLLDSTRNFIFHTAKISDPNIILKLNHYEVNQHVQSFLDAYLKNTSEAEMKKMLANSVKHIQKLCADLCPPPSGAQTRARLAAINAALTQAQNAAKGACQHAQTALEADNNAWKAVRSIPRKAPPPPPITSVAHPPQPNR